MEDETPDRKDQANQMFAEVNVMIQKALDTIKVRSGDDNLKTGKTPYSVVLSEGGGRDR